MTVIAPPVPSGTTAALAMTNVLPVQLIVETVGTGPPVGCTVRFPPLPISATVKLNDTAEAPAGTPHCPPMVKIREPLGESAGGPYSPVNPWPRVSTTRHGVRVMKWLAAEGTA